MAKRVQVEEEAAEGQIRVYCPDCRHHFDGHCNNPARQRRDEYCPYEAFELHVIDEKGKKRKLNAVHNSKREKKV